MEILLIITGVAICLLVGCLVWIFRGGDAAAAEHEAPLRRREDARDWQRRLGAGSLLLANFHQPTQNEILETLYVLDHLSPGWETAQSAEAERVFLDELALGYPTLLRPNSAFPLLSNEASAARESGALKREAFRAVRAQTNALHQIAAGSATAAPGGGEASFPRAYRRDPARGSGVLWPAMFAGAGVLVAALLGGLRFFSVPSPRTAVVLASQTPPPAEVSPVETVAPAPPGAITEASGTPAPVDQLQAVLMPAPVPDATLPVAGPVGTPLAAPVKQDLGLTRQIAASKQRAVTKYPALAEGGSEINLRFVFRYKNLVQQNSPRLLTPDWPERLAEECAVAAGIGARRDGLTQVRATPR